MVFKRNYCPICHSPMKWHYITIFGYRKDRGVCTKCNYYEEHETNSGGN